MLQPIFKKEVTLKAGSSVNVLKAHLIHLYKTGFDLILKSPVKNASRSIN